jgi:hypothetical protein
VAAEEIHVFAETTIHRFFIKKTRMFQHMAGSNAAMLKHVAQSLIITHTR